MTTDLVTRSGSMLFDLISTLEPRVRPLRAWYLESLLPTIGKWYLSEGDQGIKRGKEMLGRAWLEILGEDPGPAMAFVKSSGDKSTPTLVLPLVRRILSLTKDHRLLSAALTICRSTDLWTAKGNLASVVKQVQVIADSRLPSGAKHMVDEFIQFCHEFLSSAPSSDFRRAYKDFLRFHDAEQSERIVGELFSVKSGPNGPLTPNAHLDWCTLHEAKTSKGTTLLEEIRNLESELCKSAFGPISLESWDSWEEFSPSDISGGKEYSKYPGKISIIREKSGKVRLVASPDYYSQKALKPIHDWLMALLRTIPMDCTFDQRAAVPKIGKWQDSGRTVYSFDQSSCTDLFPMVCQLPILSARFGEPIAEAVRTVMCDREWEIKLKPGRTKVVTWGVGQPMGLYASWPLMALAHHLLVQFSYWRTSKGRKSKDVFRDYVICGDDIVIGSKSVAESYLKVVKTLGMKVNLTKSHISGGKTWIDPVSEFAKITIWKGKPLFPIRPNMVLRSMQDWRYAVPLILELSQLDGWKPKLSFFKKIVIRYYPTKQKYLLPLLTIPRFLGGIGLRDSTKLHDKFMKLRDGEIHPWLYYLGRKIRTERVLENKLGRFDFSEALPPRALREHPLVMVTEAMGSRRRRFSIPRTPLGSLPVTAEWCKVILEVGCSQFPELGIMDDLIKVSPCPIWDPYSEKKQLSSLAAWEETLRKPHFWPKPDRDSQADPNKDTAFPDDPWSSDYLGAEAQYAFVTRIMTALRFENPFRDVNPDR
jgi:hypothetical protein